jgi:hypothetical protein
LAIDCNGGAADDEAANGGGLNQKAPAVARRGFEHGARQLDAGVIGPALTRINMGDCVIIMTAKIENSPSYNPNDR